MIDQARHSPSPSDASFIGDVLVTLEVVSAQFQDAGLPRSLRTLQRYCGNGTLDCVKEATSTGDTYFVRMVSVEPAITSLKQLHDAKDRHRPGATERATPRRDGVDATPEIMPFADGQRRAMSGFDAADLAGSVATSEPDTSVLVAQLEARLGEKDAEIAFLREELTDRRGQIRDMKGIIDGQNQLLETLNTNVAPVFAALATAVEKGRIGAPVPEPRVVEQAEAARQDWPPSLG